MCNNIISYVLLNGLVATTALSLQIVMLLTPLLAGQRTDVRPNREGKIVHPPPTEKICARWCVK